MEAKKPAKVINYVDSPASKRRLSEACQRYARRHGYFTATVRTVSALRVAALAEWDAYEAQRKG
jgi:hypothetical protein